MLHELLSNNTLKMDLERFSWGPLCGQAIELCCFVSTKDKTLDCELTSGIPDTSKYERFGFDGRHMQITHDEQRRMTYKYIENVEEARKFINNLLTRLIEGNHILSISLNGLTLHNIDLEVHDGTVVTVTKTGYL